MAIARQSIYFGGQAQFGDGKPIILVPQIGNNLPFILLSNWLRVLGYRPVTTGISANFDDQSIANLIRATTQRIGRKAVLVVSASGVPLASAHCRRPQGPGVRYRGAQCFTPLGYCPRRSRAFHLVRLVAAFCHGRVAASAAEYPNRIDRSAQFRRAAAITYQASIVRQGRAKMNAPGRPRSGVDPGTDPVRGAARDPAQHQGRRIYLIIRPLARIDAEGHPAASAAR